MKIFALLAAAAAVSAVPASAAVFVVNGGTAITPTTATTFNLNNSFSTTGTFSDYYQFTLASPTAIASSGFQNTRLGTASNIDFTGAMLYSGLYDGTTAGTQLASFTYTPEDANGQETEALGTRTLTAGSYTIAVMGNVTAASALYNGQLNLAPASAVPEAATWAMMLGGFGLAGATMRSSRRSKVTFTA